MFARSNLKFEAVALPDRAKMNDDEMLAAAQSFYDAMRTRHSVRDFTSTAVSEEIIKNCIKTAGSAPSGANHQPWHFVAIKNPAIKSEIRKAAEKEEEAFYQAAQAMNG